MVKHLDPIDHAIRHLDNIGFALCEEGICTNVVGTDPEAVKRLVWLHFNPSALHRIVVRWKLALEHRWERSRRQLVGARPSTSGIRVQIGLAVSCGVGRPLVLPSIGDPERVGEAVAERDKVFDLTGPDTSRSGGADGQHDGRCEEEPVDHFPLL